jgi:hypothetical protein
MATDPVIEVVTETEFGRETVHLIERHMLVTTDPDMVVVRLFGQDKTNDVTRIGLPPARALYIGFCFIRAALRIDPTLRLQAIEEALKQGIPDIKLIAEKC